MPVSHSHQLLWASLRLSGGVAPSTPVLVSTPADTSTCRPRDVEEIDRPRRVRDVDDRRAVGLHWCSGLQRVRRAPTVMADVGDPPLALLMDDRLISGAPLERVEADQAHVVLRRPMPPWSRPPRLDAPASHQLIF